MIGQVILFGGNSSPSSDFLPCDGRILSKSDYPVLFNRIGHTHGGTGNDFKLPDLRDRAPVGVGNTVLAGNLGGAATVTVGIGNLPEHNHAVSLAVNGAVSVGVSDNSPDTEDGQGAALGKTNADDVIYTENAGSVNGALGGVAHNLSISGNTENAGGGSTPTALNNMQPYTGMLFLIKVQ